MRHGGVMDECGDEIPHTAQFVHRLFDDELENLLSDSNRKDEGSDETLREARRIAEAMVMNEEFDPV
jgi:hypothetical protein